MDGLLFLAAIIYMIVSAAGGKNKKRRQEAAKKAQQAFEAAQSADDRAEGAGARQPQPAPVRQVRSEKKRPIPSRFPEDFAEAARSFLAGAENRSTPTQQAKPAAEPRPLQEGESAIPLRRTPIESRLTQIQATQRHTLEASSLTGHAHEESSISGVQEGCAPTNPRRPIAQPSPLPASADAPVLPALDANSARLGILYGEILGKPKALRR